MSVHGTYAGWNKHNQTGVPVCDDCRAAFAQYQRARRRRIGQTAGYAAVRDRIEAADVRRALAISAA